MHLEIEAVWGVVLAPPAGGRPYRPVISGI